MKLNVKCPYCEKETEFNTQVRMKNYKHQIVICDPDEGKGPSCNKPFVVCPKFSVNIEVSTVEPKKKGKK